MIRNLYLKNSLLAFLLILSVAAVLLLRNRSPFGRDQTSFAAEPAEGITRIEISSGEKNLLLEKKGEKWLVNGKHEARSSGISFIGHTVTGIRIKSPVSPGLFEELISEQKTEPLKVRIYENRKLLSSFLVYKTNSNIYGNIMKINERSKPFIVHLPGFEGDIGSVFSTSELYWLPFTLFRLLPSEIESVEFENISDPQSSFSIQRQNNLFVLSGELNYEAAWDTSRVRRYISYFTQVPFENWAFDLDEEERRKILKREPICNISVRETTGARLKLTLWEMTDQATGLNDSDRLWGKTDNREELFILRYFDIDPLLKKISYFYPE
ncbi:MAG: hypothetical protein JXR66_00160 [Bacteroidales bacterium]|nr:hypothetical protein [Bacteroidales bacterium]